MGPILNLLAFVGFSSSLFTRALDPVIPLVAAEFKIDPHHAALLSTAFALPYALSQPVLGALADMFNKAWLIVGSLGVITLATFAGALAPNFETLVVARIVSGMMAGGLVPIAFAFVSDLVPINQRQVAMGRVLFAIMSGNLVGAIGSGLVGDWLGWRGVLCAMGGIGAIIFVISALGFRGKGKQGGRFDVAQAVAGYRAIFRNRLAKFCFGAVVFEAIFMYGLFPHLAALLYASGETRASIAGIVIAGFGLGGIIYSLRVAFLLDVLGERWMMRLGGILMGLCIVFIALQAPWQADFVAFVVLGLAFYMLHAVIQIYASELAPEARGSAMALHSFFFFLGQAAGPAVYAAGFATVGVNPILLTGGFALAATGIVCGHYLRRAKPV